MTPVIILHHHEITLKGNNRGFFERQLMRNIRTVLAGLAKPGDLSGGYGRFILTPGETAVLPDLVERLRTVFGIANICTGVKVEQEVDLFCRAAEGLLKDRTVGSLRVETRRVDKNFPVRSMEVSRRVGGYLCDLLGVPADMKNPDVTMYVLIVDGAAYVYAAKVVGACGLPAGVSGRVVGLLSAGIDSPVACWKMMRRGANVIFVHFHSMPYTSQNSVEQVRQLVRILVRYQMSARLYLVPFADVQQSIVLHSPQALRVVLYRRMMMRIAQAIARRSNAEALVTGEAVGQVASQTLRNIRVIDDAVEFPILRPLAGSDKEETMAVARAIGTFEISQEPFDDCCSFLAPRNPETWAAIEEVIAAESHLDIPSLIGRAMTEASVEVYSYPANVHAAVPAEAGD